MLKNDVLIKEESDWEKIFGAEQLIDEYNEIKIRYNGKLYWLYQLRDLLKPKQREIPAGLHIGMWGAYECDLAVNDFDVDCIYNLKATSLVYGTCDFNVYNKYGYVGRTKIVEFSDIGFNDILWNDYFITLKCNRPAKIDLVERDRIITGEKFENKISLSNMIQGIESVVEPVVLFKTDKYLTYYEPLSNTINIVILVKFTDNFEEYNKCLKMISS